MVSAGHSVTACADGYDPSVEAKVRALGAFYQPIRISRTAIRPLMDLRTISDIYRVVRRVRPQIILSYTIKPVIYSGLIAWLCRLPSTYSMITGLGYTFMEPRSLQQRISGIIARLLYRISLRHSRIVFFQNPDDLELFLEKRIVRKEQAVLINGSGVDLDHYGPSALPCNPVFLMTSRLLAEKGVREYVKAADIVRARFPLARFLLCGDIDQNPSSIDKDELRQWQEAGNIEYLGFMEDVRPAISSCRCFVLPSYYREGIPRTILEAMSIGRPVITTDSPGCRETIQLTERGKRERDLRKAVMQGENGLMIRPRDVDALVNAIHIVLESPDQVVGMAVRSREIAEDRFDVRKVNARIMESMGLAS